VGGAPALQVGVGVGQPVEALDQVGEAFQDGGVTRSSLLAEPGGLHGLTGRLKHLVVEETSSAREGSITDGGGESVNIFVGIQAAHGTDRGVRGKMIENLVDACGRGTQKENAFTASQAMGQKTGGDKRLSGAGQSLHETEVGCV
jgi:hypothetical protein